MNDIHPYMAHDPKLPTWSSLQAFAAAARHESLRDAARDLAVTPSAVSHQIRALETFVGAPLFDRGVRQVRLTPAGRRLSIKIARAFTDIAEAVETARAASATTELKIAALPLIASAWLAPRLAKFERAHPSLSLTIDTSARLADLDAREADVAIRNVASPTSGLWSRKLLDLRATPLCTREVAASLKTPADLSGATLIGLTVGRAGWPEWLAAVGVSGLRTGRMLRFDAFPDAIEAAAQGRGVLLGLLPLIFQSPAAAGLVAPFSEPPQDAGTYYVVCRRADRTNAIVTAFIDWLLAEMRADIRRLRAVERSRLRTPQRRMSPGR